MPIWAQILVPVLTAVATLVATSVTTYILNGPKRRKEEREKERKELLDKIDNLKDELETRMSAQDEQRNKVQDDLGLLKLANQAILKNDLKVRYEHWITRGYAPLDAKEDLERMYTIYHKLGANGVMDSLRADFMGLPNQKPVKPGKGNKAEDEE